MAKQLNVNLAFSADTGKAKAQIQDLQNSLNNLVKSSAAGAVSKGLPITKDLMEAQTAASKLQTILSQSMNTKTGNLDLTKFSESLNKANLNITKLENSLTKLGPEGQKAFMSLTQSIVSADVPLRRTNALVSEMWTTMKNTARWQLSSSVLHGFMGSLQSAMGYARDLDESLNNIRIVTGQNVDQMAAFADRANKAAKALSATTTQYTNASLIYYQQGLSDAEVQERADITIKMAHASGQSAEIVSDQLTAVWNNFAKGGEDLEHFADVMTALGAATASSSDEIAGGLEKFASIAEMIGLSYEYAASALATITATTRQSEDVVGTALKTIFARIQGLNLGETLDDGTTLNKYSEALQKVGISIFEQNGELKDMDNILNEMGAKWETLSKDQQVALAQTVAGVRQYNQLVSLMDNWDFFQENLDISNNSEGALQEQADIYAESWQAARDRVKAAAQDIYDSILDPDFFITFLNGLEDVLSGVANLTDALGGLPGILSLLGVVGTRVFNEQLTNAVERMAFNVKSAIGVTQQAVDKLQNDSLEAVQKIEFNTGTSAGDAQATALKYRLNLQREIKQISKGLTEENKEQLNALLKINDAYAEQAIQVAKEKDQASQKAQESRGKIREKIATSNVSNMQKEKGYRQLQIATQNMQETSKIGIVAAKTLDSLSLELTEADRNSDKFAKSIENVRKGLNNVGREQAVKLLDKYAEQFNKGEITAAQFREKLISLGTAQDMLDDTAVAAASALEKLKVQFNLSDELCVELANHMGILTQKQMEEKAATDAQKKGFIDIQTAIRGFQQSMDSIGKSMVKTMQGISSITMGLTSLKAVWDTLDNPDLSNGEKILQITMSLSMAIPSLIMGYDNLKEAKIGEALASVKVTLTTALEAAAKDKVTISTIRATGGVKGYIVALWAQVAATTAAKIGISSLTAALGIAGIAIVGITAIAFLLVKAFNKIKESTPEGKIKALEEELSNAEEAFNRVTNAVNETKSAIDNLDNSYNKLSSLTKGTAEWAEQVSKVNAEILNLVDKYPELAKFVTQTEDGVLAMDAGWRNYMDTTMTLQTTAANNLKLNARKKLINQEIENNNKVTTVNLDYVPEFKGKQHDLLKEAQELYNNPEIGELLFTDYGSKKLSEKIDNKNAYGVNQLQNFIKSNRENIIAPYETQKEIKFIEDQQFNSKLNIIGTNRNQKEVLDLLNVDDYSTLMNNVEQQVKKDFGDWQRFSRFTSATQQQYIKDFAEMQGIGEAVYTGQKSGKMTFEDVEGKQYEFDKDTFFESIGELYSSTSIQSLMADQIKSDLKDNIDSFKNINILDDLQDTDTIQLDNVLNQIIENSGNENYGKEIFNSLIEEAYGATSEGIEKLVEDTSDIIWDADGIKKFNEAIKEFETSTADDKAERLTSNIRELNAAGQMEGMGDTFAQAAESFGLEEEAGAEMHEYAKHLMEIADESDILSDELDENAKDAAKLAIQVTRMNKGIDTLADNFEEWGGVLKKSSKESAEYSKALSGTKKALSDILDVETDFITDNFVEEHLKDIEKAATGDAKAIDALKVALADEIILNIVGVESLEDLDTELLNNINNLKEQIENNPILIGTHLDYEGLDTDEKNFLNTCQKIINQANMTAEQANSYFSQMGFDTEFLTKPQIQTQRVPEYVTETAPDGETTVTDIGPDGKPITRTYTRTRTRTYQDGFYEAEGTIDAIAMATIPDGKGGTKEVPQIKSMTRKADGGMNNYSSSNSGGKGPGKKSGKSGGGGSKSKPAEKVDLTKRSDIVDRYKEIDDTLDDIEDAMSDVNKEADRLFGSARLKAMRQEKDLLLQQADALRKKKLEAENYYNTDRQSLITESAKYSITWEFGKDGDILNYTDQMNKLFNELNAAEVKMNGLATKEAQDEFKTASIEPIKQKIEDIKNALSQYEDTKELLKDLDNQLQEAIWAWQDKNFEELEYKLELKLDIDDADLKHLDYLMNKWSDDFFKMAETAALMYSRTEYDQVDGYSNQLANYREHELALKEKYANDEISQADYIEGLKNVRDGYYEQLEALNELDKTMLHYYEDTLSAASEELDDYTDHMEHLTGVFDHYLNLMDLLGKQKDFDALGDFLGGKAETTRDQLNVAKDYYDMLLEQKEETEREYNKAIRSGDEESIKFWQEQWDAIVDATDEAQEEMLSLTETWVENMRAVIQNNMDKLAADLEKSLTGEFMNFDVLMDSFDKLNTRQEEYLTKTNQIYETNKLIRQASQKIDETDNKVAKQKMQNFITETKSLQENNQLSEYELEIQQAKYELLLAEIALEEAQNAKSTVRLSRDSEGNFGYVYTADQDAVDDAEQGLDDAKNRLYNLSLEGQQEYTEKYLQAQQSMYEELTELQQMFLDGELASEEEYQLRKEEIINHYYGENGILRTYSNLYNVAVQTDAAATADYWGKQYGAMTQATDDWQVAVNKYLEEVEEETEEWADVSKQANRDVEGALKNSSKATKELTSESDKLGKEIRNDLIPAMDKEFERIQKNIKEYERERDAIRDMIEEYEEYIRLINQNIKDASDDEDNSSESSFTNKKYRDDYAADIRDLVLNKGFEIESDTVQTLLEERQEKIDSDPNKWSAMSNEELINNIEKDKKKVTSMATGGFTGQWGPDGKLAFLHEKELVLNQDDTSNLLKTISFIREIVSMIDSQASFANLGFLSTPGFSNAIDHNFEQTVSIYAEFPSATNHTEIEEAFNNLLNTASQYANRKE